MGGTVTRVDGAEFECVVRWDDGQSSTELVVHLDEARTAERRRRRIEALLADLGHPGAT